MEKITFLSLFSDVSNFYGLFRRAIYMTDQTFLSKVCMGVKMTTDYQPEILYCLVYSLWTVANHIIFLKLNLFENYIKQVETGIQPFPEIIAHVFEFFCAAL